MIDLFYWPTPNGHKITLMLEECGLEYRIHPINIGAGDQFKPEFLALSPNNRMPAIIDQSPNDGGDPVRLFESGAILLYLAEKTGRFMASDMRTRYQTIQWLMWQMGGLGPMAGQNHHFNLYAPEPIPYAQERYTKETARLYHVLDVGLEGRDYLAGQYSIADMACYPWIVPHVNQKQDLNDFPNVKAWFERIGARPATAKAYAVGEGMRPSRPPTEEERENMFGEKQKRR
ncbi:MAG: thiol:disulfide oxidoreductase [Gammaproteobacteria bacterium]|nr:thiol:disulfide oxidoreductase [Gammaproteobacteria bacterium]